MSTRALTPGRDGFERAQAATWLASGTRAAVLVILIVALVGRVAWVSRLGDALSWSDEQEFVTVARHLAAGDGYVSTSFRANPVLPVYLSAFFRVFGEGLLAPRLGQAFVGALTCVLIAWIARSLFGAAVGVLAGLMVALYPPHVFLSGIFYVDCLATFLLALGVALGVRALQGGLRAGFVLATGVVLGLTVLARPTFFVYLPCVALVFLCARSIDVRRRFAAAVLVLVAGAATISPWTLRNYRTYGRFVMVTSGFGTKLWQGNTVLANGGPNDRELMWGKPDWKQRMEALPPAERAALEARYAVIAAHAAEREAALGDHYLATDEVLGRVAVREMLDDPKRTFVLALKKTATLYSAFTETLTTNAYTRGPIRLLAALSFYPVLALAVVGAWLARRAGPPVWLLYLLIGSVTAGYAVLNACTRFRLPLDPFLIVFAALALERVAVRFAGARPRAAA